jgi:flagellar basal-body rod modification protein FlgD
MVEQLKHQDPTNPTDSNQFLTQLAQFTELEQVTNLRTDADSINAILTKAFGPAPTDAGGTTGAGGSTGTNSSTGNFGATN